MYVFIYLNLFKRLFRVHHAYHVREIYIYRNTINTRNNITKHIYTYIYNEYK